ncbi:hypothetical protein [Sediminispirochaeta bajacaliforniensis]|uniref:hypothetical protein n=1 Tax=Sediminispirochaeta bajacaliforniensis TaxID=148 RepID=UPI000367B3A3|nr:hypothetical protein [Sediminispirochaeta bajacaliforniensis]
MKIQHNLPTTQVILGLLKEPWKAKMGPVYASVEKLISSQAWAKLHEGADAIREK